MSAQAAVDWSAAHVESAVTDTVRIARRFRGPPGSGNGGYVCGLLGRRFGGASVVRLHVPPPLETELRVEVCGETQRLVHGSALVAEGRPAPLDLALPSAPSLEVARAAARNYAGFRQHPFPACFGCGPDRAPNDGLRIHPGAINGGPLLAAPWVPDGSLAGASGSVEREFVWAALDCPGGWATASAGLPPGTVTVLGEMRAELRNDVPAGEACVVLSWPCGTQGRRRYAGSALYARDGTVLAAARTTWIEVPESAFRLEPT